MGINENSQIIRAVYDAYARGDLEFVLNSLADDIDWQLFIPQCIPYSGRYRGQDEVRRFFSLFSEYAQIQQFEVHEYIAGEEGVTVLGWDRILVKPTNREFEMEWAHVYNLEKSKVVRFREYFDTAPMIEAFKNA